MTSREKFEQEMREKEQKPIEDEDEEDSPDKVSFEGKYVYLKMWTYFFVFIATCYYGHLKITAFRDGQRERFNQGKSREEMEDK
jgi:hypothetical protein